MTPQQKLADLKAQVAKLEAQIANKRWKPDVGQIYYVPDCSGGGSSLRWGGSAFHEHLHATRNVFRTREEAEKAHNLRMVRYELMDLADEAWGDTAIEWDLESEQRKFYADVMSGEFCIEYTYAQKAQGAIYFPSKDSYRAAIQKIGEERFIEFVKEGV